MGKIMTGLLAGISLWGASTAHALTVTPGSDAATLAGALEGGGITVSDAYYTGAGEASGTFGAGVGIGLSSGLILTTGSAGNALLPVSGDASTPNGGGSGSGFTGFGLNTFDFASLRFDFTTSTGNLFFSYRFASEEVTFLDSTDYQVSDFDDKAGIFLDGKAITPFISVYEAAVDPGFLDGNHIPIAYNGITPILFYRLTGLDTTIPHVIEIGIADGGDDKLDSALLIGPLSATAPVPEPSTLALLGLGLGGGIWWTRKKRRS